MATLVTGGTGYVGGAVVRALCDRGEQVRVLARKTSNTKNLTNLGVEIAYGDIRDQYSLETALHGCDTLYHAAAIYSYWVPDKALLMQTEIEGTRNVMTAARNDGVSKVVYTSTTFTIGEKRGEVGNENTPHRGYFCTAYEEAKYRAELVVQEFAQQGLPVVIVNPGGVYGPGGLGATGEPIVDALNGKLPMIFPGIVSMVYIEDAVQGHLLAAEKGQLGERYLLTGGYIDIVEFIQRICQLAGVKPPMTGPVFMAQLTANVTELVSRITKRPPLLAKDTVAMASHGAMLDGSKAEQVLGIHYTPLEEALIRTLEWYWAQGLLKQKPKCVG